MVNKCHQLIISLVLIFSKLIFFSDLCAAVWFSYTLIFFQLQFKSNIAGVLILLGQVADAIATPFVGFESDRNICVYTITWLLLSQRGDSTINKEDSVIFYGIFTVTVFE